ncbi:hypothetical protein [Agrobacterium sp. CG674]
MLSISENASKSVNTYLPLFNQSDPMIEPQVDPNHPRFSLGQLRAIGLLDRGDLVLTNDGQYALRENGDIDPEQSVRKPILRALADKGMVEYHDEDGSLFWRITPVGKAAADPSSPWQRPMAPPGRQPKPKPVYPEAERVARSENSDVRSGALLYFVHHPFVEGKAYTTVTEANLVARQIQAGCALSDQEIPVINVEHRRYAAFSQKMLARLINGTLQEDDVVEHRMEPCRPHLNKRTYAKYEAITQ